MVEHDWVPLGRQGRIRTDVCTRCRVVSDGMIPFKWLYQAPTGAKLSAEPACGVDWYAESAQ